MSLSRLIHNLAARPAEPENPKLFAGQLGKALAARRAELGYPQTWVARRLGLKSQSEISAVEHATRDAQAGRIVDHAGVLGMHLTLESDTYPNRRLGTTLPIPCQLGQPRPMAPTPQEVGVTVLTLVPPPSFRPRAVR